MRVGITPQKYYKILKYASFFRKKKQFACEIGVFGKKVAVCTEVQTNKIPLEGITYELPMNYL